MQVADGVHRLRRGVVNFYLVEDGGRLALVDAGGSRDWGVLIRTLASINRGLGDLEAVVLTHAHSDHVGFSERARVDAGATVRVHRSDAEAARTGKSEPVEAGYGKYLLRPEAYRTLLSLALEGGLKIAPVAVVSSFEDGETLGVPGRPRVVLAPGHTDGSCVLMLEARRVVLSGDCLVTRNPLTGRVGPQIMPAGLNRSSSQALASLDALASLPADVVLPGHGEPWTAGIAEAVSRAKAAGPS